MFCAPQSICVAVCESIIPVILTGERSVFFNAREVEKLYQALYRTWRPQVFEDVVGQKPITDTLRHEVSSNRLAHAYLFTGSRGTGKTTCSKILAKVVNCLNPIEGDPCGVCENCQAIAQGAMTDILEIDAASNNSVDDVRALREEAIFAPAMGKYRVYIIDEAHMLSKSAFNALLKIMEEPPEWVLFILATTEVHKLPSTILSRCQRFDFRRVSAEDIGNHLLHISEQEGIPLDSSAATLIGQISDGGMRDAISLLDQCAALGETVTVDRVRQVAGLTDPHKVYALVNAIIYGDKGTLLTEIGELHSLSVDFRQLSQTLLEYFRNLMVIKSVAQPEKLVLASSEEISRMQEQARHIEMSQVLYAVDTLQELYRRIGTDRSGVALFEMTLLKLSDPGYSDTNEALAARLERLEAGAPPRREKQTSISTKFPQQESSGSLPQANGKNTPEQNQKEIHEDAVFKEEPEVSPHETIEEEALVEVTADFSAGMIPPPTEENPPYIPDLPTPSPLLSSQEEETSTIEIEGELESWSEILVLIKTKNPPLHATLEGSRAFLKGDILLIDAENPVFFDLMRTSDVTKESLRNAISQITGKVYRLGPLKKGTVVKEKPKGIDALRQAAKKGGIELTEK